VKKLICYLFDRSDRGIPIANVYQGLLDIDAAGLAKWLAGSNQFLIALRDKRPAIEANHAHELYAELQALAKTVVQPMEWKCYVRPGGTAEIIFDSVPELVTDDPDIELDGDVSVRKSKD
jgi:hypothetical protein